MATVKVTLKQGLKIGEDLHLEAELREVTAGDLIEATEESERLILTPDGDYVLLPSNTMVGLHTLRRQVVRIGEHTGPLTLGELKRLSGGDLNLLQESALKLDRATLKEVAEQGKKP